MIPKVSVIDQMMIGNMLKVQHFKVKEIQTPLLFYLTKRVGGFVLGLCEGPENALSM